MPPLEGGIAILESPSNKRLFMNNIFYIIGVIVVVVFILKAVGLW